MSVREYELFHGAVLTKILRSDNPISIRLIETHPNDTWSVYTINDEIELFLKHSASPRSLSRGRGGYSWTFTFNPDHKIQLLKLQAKRPTYVALICGQNNVKHGRMEVCLLKPDDLKQVIDVDTPDTQSITIRYIKGAKKFRVFLNHQEKLLISLNEIERWVVPGS